MNSDAMSAKEVLNDFKENYSKIRKLLDESSKNDPENEPFVSKYKAKHILSNMRDSLNKMLTCRSDIEGHSLYAMLGCVLLNIGIIDMETEELTASEKVLVEAVEILSPFATEPEIVITLINIYNNLGMLWSNRDDPEKAKTYLNDAKVLYEKFKWTLQMPLPIEHIINYTGENVLDDFMFLEKAYTLTLFYLAQVFGSLKENIKSAIYCHLTLRRQLQYGVYDPIDWALNSATMSQFFAQQNGFYQSRHHLAAASTILDKYEETLRASESESETHLAKLEVFKHRSADVARCWVKYCILLMESSKARLLNDSESPSDTITDLSNLTIGEDECLCDGNIKNLVFTDLDVSKYVNKITDKYLLTFQDAREVFLSCQTWLNKAKEYYNLDTLASDYIELVRDSSESYIYLAFFEDDDERRAKMLKRRIDMLENLLTKINPVYYLQYCRHLWYDLGIIYTDVLSIKLEKLNSTQGKTTPHAIKKINTLCEKSIENFTCFLDSVKDKNGIMPVKLENELITPVVTAYSYIGRNVMKVVSVDKRVQLNNVKKSYDSFQSVVDICKNSEEAASLMHEQYMLCQEMLKILPLKIKKLESVLENNVTSKT